MQRKPKPNIAKDLVKHTVEHPMLPISGWKRKFFEERIAWDNANPGNGIEWSELKKKYFTK